MGKEDKQIDSSSKKEPTEKKEKVEKDEKGQPLTEQDIALIKRYGKGPYTEKIKVVEDDIKNYNTKITALCGIKESDTGLALPAQWNLQQDAMMMKQESTLQVGRCTKIMNKGSEDAKYIVALKHMGKFVVGLDEKLAPTDVEEGMRVGTQRAGEIGSKL
jgi:26S proteasome regulatory subunit T1